LRSHTYTEDLERQGELQPGMSRHHREWNAENGVREPAADLIRMAEDVRNRLIDRVGDIGPGDRVTARLMLEAVGVIREAGLEIERLRAERDEANANAKLYRDERDAARAEATLLRPSVCLGAQTASEYAEARGWDCFKEDGK